jgi:transcriptional regulator with XRE-family HTH domain
VPSVKPKPCKQRKQLGKNVAKLRKASGLTQEKLAEKIGVSTWFVQMVEAGVNFPSLPKLSKLKTALDCSWNRLLDGCDEV